MSDIQTISDFLRLSGAEYQIYDLGRRIVQLDRRRFENIERVKEPAPYPILRSICIAVLFWYKRTPDEQMVWFLRFPLDETGYLVQLARDEFLAQLLERVGANIEAVNERTNEATKAMESAGDESRFAFSPSDEQRAVFHARATHALGMPPSKHYPHAVDYLRGIPGYDQWAFVGLQGLADVCTNLKSHENDLITALPQLPAQVLGTVCSCLDSEVLSGKLTNAILRRLKQALAEQHNSPAVAPLVRAAAGSRARSKRGEICRLALKAGGSDNIELLATIAGRCWEELRDEEFCLNYLEALAASDQGQTAFDHLVADLMFLPGMRDHILRAFRNPQRSATLANAIGQFFAALQSPQSKES